jgi:hypothetical protein
MSQATLPQIFVSYSHHDSDWRAQLFDDGLETTFGDCQVWSDAQLRAGDRWREQIEQRLAGAAVAVLLVSAQFLESTFIAERELPTILARAQQAGLRVVWIPIAIDRTTLESRRPDLAALQGGMGFELALPARPHDGGAEALERVRKHIRQQLRAAIDPRGADLSQLVAERYDVEHRLGEGNLAAVYQARDRVLLRSVAIKVLKDPSQRQAFLDDVRDALRTSEEPNFINIYDAGSKGSTAYCVVQHLQGKTLHALLRDPQYADGLPVQTVRRVFLRLVTAISRAHAMGISYGNLKPSNVFLDESFEPFILPMGRRRDAAREHQAAVDLVARLGAYPEIGQAPDDNDLEDLTYLVPERFGEQIDEFDARLADQYMLGVLTYEMATGQRPLLVAEPRHLLRDGLDAFQPLPPLTDRRPLCPQRLAAMVARMAAPDPAQRYPQLAEVLQEPDLQDELALVVARDSYRRCVQAEGFDSRFFATFYDQLMQRCPAARDLFKDFSADDWARQHRMVKDAVLLLFAFAQQRDDRHEPNLLSRIAHSHARVPASMYPPFVDALVHTVCGDDSGGLPPFDPACSQRDIAHALARHWRSALAPGIAYLQAAAQAAR